MHPQWLDLPARSGKPRTAGLTMVIDNGLPTGWFADAVASSASHIDMVKFGWGTCMVTADLDRKIGVLADHGIRFCFGGTLFEKFVIQGRFDGFLEFCRRWRCDLVEVSNGTIPLSNSEKADYIRRCASEFAVTSEVGFKDQARAEEMTAAQWVDCIAEDLAAGAELVITEARESGRSGMCRPDGRLRAGLLESILAGGADVDRLLFEAPTKDLQAQFVTLLGPDVNLGNVSLGDVIALETLRLGLRGDTLLHFEAVSLYA
ncbi:MAG TPA: phosphosulfolactate synthase [Acidimicrobiia bacterium]|jgi:phosphosulfolactate synthase|nr:phosphosulfolactate synthase [Acidimicrobiia bacterium]